MDGVKAVLARDIFAQTKDFIIFMEKVDQLMNG
jgi:hypothetical protein